MHKFKVLLALLWTLGIAVVCLMSSSNVPKITIAGKDKLIHFLFYLGFVVLWMIAWSTNQSRFSLVKKLSLIFIIALSYGIVMELAQSIFTTTRTADIFDVFANASGALFGVVVMYFVHHKKA